MCNRSPLLETLALQYPEDEVEIFLQCFIDEVWLFTGMYHFCRFGLGKGTGVRMWQLILCILKELTELLVCTLKVGGVSPTSATMDA